jgi:Rps23 Pro-64 3,4-dihydroxylase Tpa1-like proline 4-hydroxylase
MIYNLDGKKVLKHDIVAYENFISPEHCDAILKYWEHSTEKGTLPWGAISFYESFSANLPEDADMLDFGLPENFFKDLEAGIQAATEDTRGKPIRKVSYHAQKWIEGAFAGFHSDNSSLDDPEYNAFERSKMATFLYLNEDFEGGELNFRDHDIKIKPTKGLLVAFEGGHHNIHEVLPIESGVRFTVGSFWDFDEIQYTDETKARWETEISEARIQQAKDAEEWANMRERGERLRPGPGVSSKPTKGMIGNEG